MARLHKEFCGFDGAIMLTESRKNKLKTSRKELRRKIRNWFQENNPDELQPKFHGQGSFEMNTTVNPIKETDSDGNDLLKYDLDDGVYFVEKDGEDNRKTINTWHDWVFQSTDNHTGEPTKKKNTCVRVVFKDGHHIDLPIYYKVGDTIELAHKSKGWLISDPKKFYEWFNENKCTQSEKLVRYIKAWKNSRELNNVNVSLPSGFAFTILVVEHYVESDFDDDSLQKTIQSIYDELSAPHGFCCKRPTTQTGEDVFKDFSETRKTNTLLALKSLLDDLKRAEEEPNFKKASEILIDNQFGNRFPKGEDKDEESKSKALSASISGALISPKPYAAS